MFVQAGQARPAYARQPCDNRAIAHNPPPQGLAPLDRAALPTLYDARLLQPSYLMPSLNDIRATFLDYFGKAGHAVTPSAPLVPQNDPTLLFVNAGMVPFKNVFTGAEPATTPRATSSQKCVRAGGKHNDLDNVGYTARHHTFFEMLGNFSFGDYFKEGAIELAWTLITKEFGLPRRQAAGHRLSRRRRGARPVEEDRRPPDDRIIRIATSDNFWSMGDTGPCGPCSEIFYDHGEALPGGPPGSPDEDGDRFRGDSGTSSSCSSTRRRRRPRTPLPKPSIDTGMGLERIAARDAGRPLQLRHRPVQDPDRRLGGGHRREGRGRRATVAPGDRRPPALLGLPDRGRGLALQRGPRLCAAPDHAPRHAPRPPAGRAGAR